MPKSVIEFTDMVQATERSMYERGIDPRGDRYRSKFARASMLTLPDTTEGWTSENEGSAQGLFLDRTQSESCKDLSHGGTANRGFRQNGWATACGRSRAHQ